MSFFCQTNRLKKETYLKNANSTFVERKTAECGRKQAGKTELEKKPSWCNNERQVLVFFALSKDLRGSQVLEGIGARSISNAKVKCKNNVNVLLELSQRLQCANI